MTVGITSACDNISLRIASYSDEMNILKKIWQLKIKSIYETKTMTEVYKKFFHQFQKTILKQILSQKPIQSDT